MRSKSDTPHDDLRFVEAEAFRAGANDVPKEPGIAEIRARFKRRQAEAREEATSTIREMEALASHLTRLNEEAQMRWESLKAGHEDNVPRFWLPLGLLVASFGAVLVEATFLAPALDMIGLADRNYQLVVAAALVAGAAVILHLCVANREKDSSAWWPFGLGTFVVVGLVLFGLFRSRQIGFAAKVTENLFGQFLAESPWLRDAVFVFITLLFPVAAAMACSYAAHELHEWLRYVKARRAAWKLGQKAPLAEQTLAAAKEETEQQFAQLVSQAEEWTAAYETFHALGVAVGARQRPQWVVWAKAAAIAIVCFVASMLLQLGPVIAGGSAVAAGLAAAVYFHHRWSHPTSREYLKLANLRFQDATNLALDLPGATVQGQRPSEPERTLTQSTERALPAARGDGEALREVS